MIAFLQSPDCKWHGRNPYTPGPAGSMTSASVGWWQYGLAYATLITRQTNPTPTDRNGWLRPLVERSGRHRE